MGELLHPAFRAFGRSGSAYTRHEVLLGFSNAPQDYRVWAQDFAIEHVEEGVALLTYRSAHITQSGELERHS